MCQHVRINLWIIFFKIPRINNTKRPINASCFGPMCQVALPSHPVPLARQVYGGTGNGSRKPENQQTPKLTGCQVLEIAALIYARIVVQHILTYLPGTRTRQGKILSKYLSKFILHRLFNWIFSKFRESSSWNIKYWIINILLAK